MKSKSLRVARAIKRAINKLTGAISTGLRRVGDAIHRILNVIPWVGGWLGRIAAASFAVGGASLKAFGYIVGGLVGFLVLVLAGLLLVSGSLIMKACKQLERNVVRAATLIFRSVMNLIRIICCMDHSVL